jgi:hypothetical protein
MILKLHPIVACAQHKIPSHQTSNRGCVTSPDSSNVVVGLMDIEGTARVVSLLEGNVQALVLCRTTTLGRDVDKISTRICAAGPSVNRRERCGEIRSNSNPSSALPATGPVLPLYLPSSTKSGTHADLPCSSRSSVDSFSHLSRSLCIM